MDDMEIKRFVEHTDRLRDILKNAAELIYNTKPHPVDRVALQSYLVKLQVGFYFLEEVFCVCEI